MTQSARQDRHRNPFGKLDCPQPGCDRVGERGFDGPQGRGSHVKAAHGIAGSSTSTLAARRAKERGRSEPNTWGKHDCPQRHCDRKGQHGLPTPRALGRHLQAMHGQPGGGSQAERRRRRRKVEPAALARMDQCHQGDHDAEEHAEVHVAVKPVPSPPHADPLHYCPGCGFDLDAAKQHLHPSIRDSAYIRCPQCRTNLAVVSAVLRPDMQAIQPEHALALVEAARRVSSVL